MDFPATPASALSNAAAAGTCLGNHFDHPNDPDATLQHHLAHIIISFGRHQLILAASVPPPRRPVMFNPSGLIARRTGFTTLRHARRTAHYAELRPSAEAPRPYHSLDLLLPRAAGAEHRPRLTFNGAISARYQSNSSNSGGETTKYTFDDLQAHLAPAHAGGPDPRPAPLLLIDVREPAELQATGRIPTAHNLPISSVPDGAFLPSDEFEDRFGFPKPVAGDEVVFYCKSGVRSRAAAQMVAESWSREGIKVSEFPGSWTEWERRGGEAEK